MRIRLLLAIYALLLLILQACFCIETYPPEPQISLKYFTLNDTTDALGNPGLKGEMCISFIDGDGDIGYNEPADTSLIDSMKTVFIKQYYKVNGIFVESQQQVDYSYRVPFFSTEPNNPSLKGDIIIHDLNSYGPFEGDTIKYTVYIRDRAGNRSNTAETEELVLINYVN